MENNLKKRMLKLITPTVFLLIILVLMYFLNYIDVSVILTIYLPIWSVGVIAVIFGKIVFSIVSTVFAGVGLIVNYLIDLSNGAHPNMEGAFLNTLIVFFGLILGIVLQIINSRKRIEQ